METETEKLQTSRREGREPLVHVTSAAESLREGSTPTSNFLNAKDPIRIGTWNVRTMWEPSRIAQATKIMTDYQLDILGVSESRWTGSGKSMAENGVVILHSGLPEGNAHVRGVALMISRNAAQSLLAWNPVDERLITARFQGRHCKLTIIQCYAPTNEAPEETKDLFYEKLRGVVERVPSHDVLIVMGDLNAKVGSENTGYERAMGRHGCGTMNENGERLVGFCLDNDLVVGGTLFQHKEIHKLTWKSPGNRTSNQIDHITINGRWKRSLNDVRAYRGADIYSDHFLLVCSLRLKLRRAYCRRSVRQRYHNERLKHPEVCREFSSRLRSNLQECLQTGGIADPQRGWVAIRESYCKAAEATLMQQGKERRKWISDETWRKVEERGKIKAKLLDSKSQRIRSNGMRDETKGPSPNSWQKKQKWLQKEGI